MTCVYSDNFLNLTLYLDLLLVAGSHPAKDETSSILVIIIISAGRGGGVVMAWCRQWLSSSVCTVTRTPLSPRGG